ncbi:hypothetical protein BDF14DRAFT_1439186 [Spinellus fusiger]|nr:hypothetical protein BDF14DRAFT_1439186 [Spinellus fusiger]
MSCINKTLHHPSLSTFVSQNQMFAIASLSQEPIDDAILDLVTQEFMSIIPCQMDDLSFSKHPKQPSVKVERQCFSSSHDLPSPPLSSSDTQYLSNYTNITKSGTSLPLRDFIASVVKRSQTTMGTLLSSLVYAHRLRLKLSRSSKGMKCTHHRIFLATLITTTKYLHDTAPRNKYWVWYAQLFSAVEISLMERQLLQLLVCYAKYQHYYLHIFLGV